MSNPELLDLEDEGEVGEDLQSLRDKGIVSKVFMKVSQPDKNKLARIDVKNSLFQAEWMAGKEIWAVSGTKQISELLMYPDKDGSVNWVLKCEHPVTKVSPKRLKEVLELETIELSDEELVQAFDKFQAALADSGAIAIDPSPEEERVEIAEARNILKPGIQM